MSEKKKSYARRQELDEIMTIACTQGVTGQIVRRFEEYRKGDKDIITNLKKGNTFIRKAMEAIFDKYDEKVLLDIKNFVESKEIFILDPKDADIIRKRAKKEDEHINIGKQDMIDMCNKIKGDVCINCNGSCSPSCPYHKVMLINCLTEGSDEYTMCPFAFGGKGN